MDLLVLQLSITNSSSCANPNTKAEIDNAERDGNNILI
jgi:hypothetical protein